MTFPSIELAGKRPQFSVATRARRLSVWLVRSLANWRAHQRARAVRRMMLHGMSEFELRDIGLRRIGDRSYRCGVHTSVFYEAAAGDDPHVR